MNWEKDAEKAMEKVPFFVRRMVRSRVEDYVRKGGRGRVTVQDVYAARDVFKSDSDPKPLEAATDKQRAAQSPTEVTMEAVGAAAITEAGLSESQIRRIEQLVERTAGHEARFYSIKACGGAVGCPLTKFDVRKMADTFREIIDSSGLVEAITGKVRGPALSHHKFKVALAGCPNNCSEPQIKDFAVTAISRPGPGPGDCIECGKCEAACKEAAITVDGEPRVNRSLCVGCGDCAEVCPTQALVVEKEGYTIWVGGKLGRHPQLAIPVVELADEETVYRALRASIELLREEGREGERLGAVLNRVAIEGLGARLIGDASVDYPKHHPALSSVFASKSAR